MRPREDILADFDEIPVNPSSSNNPEMVKLQSPHQMMRLLLEVMLDLRDVFRGDLESALSGTPEFASIFSATEDIADSLEDDFPPPPEGRLTEPDVAPTKPSVQKASESPVETSKKKRGRPKKSA